MQRRQKIVSWLVATMMAIMPSSAVFAATTIGNNVSVGGTLSVTGATTFSGAATISGLATFSGGLLSSGNLNASSSVFLSGVATTTISSITVGANVLPGSNNTINFGVFGTAFKDTYTSGTVFAATTTIFNTTGTSTIYAASSATNAGGALILEANGTCYAVYIGSFAAGITGVTSTALTACPTGSP